MIDNLLFGWINRVCGGARKVEKVLDEMDTFYQEFIHEHLSPNRLDSMAGDILDLLIRLREDESAPVKIDLKHIKAILMVTKSSTSVMHFVCVAINSSISIQSTCIHH